LLLEGIFVASHSWDIILVQCILYCWRTFHASFFVFAVNY
jgi:hypothetical protein